MILVALTNPEDRRRRPSICPWSQTASVPETLCLPQQCHSSQGQAWKLDKGEMTCENITSCIYCSSGKKSNILQFLFYLEKSAFYPNNLSPGQSGVVLITDPTSDQLAPWTGTALIHFRHLCTSSSKNLKNLVLCASFRCLPSKISQCIIIAF